MQNIITSISLLLLIQTTVFGQSGWAKGQGEAFFQISVNTFSSNNFYSLNGELFDQGNNFQSQAVMLYGEYGITNRITSIINAPLYKSNRFSNTERVSGVGDIRIGAKYAVSQQIPISLAIEAEIPTGNGTNFASVTKNPVVPGERINLPISDGEFNVWSTLAISQSFPSGNTYGSLYGQYNIRTQGFSDQYRLGLEIGQKFIERLWLIGRLGIQERVTDEIQPDLSFLYGEGTTYTTFGLTSMFSVTDQWMITASFSDYAGFITDRRNIYDGATFSFGVAWDMK